MHSTCALLIDGDNISADYAHNLENLIDKYGQPFIRRIYGNASNCPTWISRFGYRFIHCNGENAADMQLAVDAMSLTFQQNIQTLILVSSDRDFTPLAHSLRELGRTVVGIGEGKAPLSFRAACSHFHVLETGTIFEIAQQILTDATLGNMKIVDFAAIMKTKYNVMISKTEHKNWRGFFTKHQSQFRLDASGANARVYLR